MNLLQLKEVFDLNKNKTITLNDDYYIFIFNKYYEIMDKLYYSILNVKPSSDEYNHMLYAIIEKSEENNMTKEQILIQIVNYIFENPLFEDIFKKFTQI